MKFRYMGVVGLAAAATLAGGAPAEAAHTATLCSYLKAAIGDAPNHFANITDAKGVTDPYFPSDASNCGGGEARPGQFISACFWILPDADEAAAASKLAALSAAVGDCIGSGYHATPEVPNGMIFRDDAKVARLRTRSFRDNLQRFQIYVMVAAPDAMIK